MKTFEEIKKETQPLIELDILRKQEVFRKFNQKQFFAIIKIIPWLAIIYFLSMWTPK